jgi:hypothetical protein
VIEDNLGTAAVFRGAALLALAGLVVFDFMMLRKSRVTAS